MNGYTIMQSSVATPFRVIPFDYSVFNPKHESKVLAVWIMSCLPADTSRAFRELASIDDEKWTELLYSFELSGEFSSLQLPFSAPSINLVEYQTRRVLK